MPAGRLYEFGEFRLDATERLLFRANNHVPLPPKAMDILVLLVERRGHLVDKDTLLKEIWPDTFVEEGSLTQNVSVLRKILTEARDGKEMIETIPKRGYRFIAPVREIEPEAPPRPSPTGTPAPVKQVSPSWRRRLVWIAAIAVVALTGGGYFLWHHFSPRPTAPSQRIMLAVLPVQNLTGNPEQDYLSDGLTDEMIAQLGNLGPQRLGVIARTSSMAYKKTTKTVDQIGRELRVDYVLETSVRSSGERLRVTAQLIRTRDQTHIWSSSYDRALGDILTLESEAAREVAYQIRLALTPQEEARLAKPRPVNPQAYDAYLKGRFFWNIRTPEAMTSAESYFRQAIQADPNYAPGYAGLADCYQVMVDLDQLRANDGYPRARAAALKALELDKTLAEAHTSLASVKGDFDWDWQGAEAEYKQALELNPNYATAHHWYADFLAGLGRLEEATTEIKRAREIDPLSPVIGVTLGQMYCRAGHCDQGVDEYKKILEMYPAFLQGREALAEAYAQMGRYEKSLAELEQPFPRRRSVLWGYTLAASGRRREALNLVEELKSETGWEHVDYALAAIYAGLGDNDQAFTSLESARRSRDFWMAYLQTDFKLYSLRSDPRYQDLLRRMNLPVDKH